MKKILLLCFGVILGLSMLTLTSCKKITSLTLERFSEKATEHDYEVEVGENVVYAYKGTKNNYNYVIEFNSYNNLKEAKQAYKLLYKELPSNKSSSIESNMLTYSYIKLTSGDKYYVLYRVSLTVLVVTADQLYKEEIKKFINNIGY